MVRGIQRPAAFAGMERAASQAPLPEAPVPFVHEQTIRWADCDPAQIAYTGNIPSFALNAIDAWWKAVCGADFFHLNMDHGLGTPFVRIEMDLKSPITPRHALVCEVVVMRLGGNSITHRVTGRQAGEISFNAHFVSVFVDAGSFEKIAMPEAVRQAATPHLCTAPPAPPAPSALDNRTSGSDTVDAGTRP